MLKVLIADDERNIREGIQCLVDWEGLGCEVVFSCGNGSLALRYIQANDVDIVVTDIKMPVMDGLELSRQIAESFNHIKVIILTAYSDFEMARNAIRYGVEDFIVKNNFMGELPDAIEKASEHIRKEAKMNMGYVLDDERRMRELQGFRYCICSCEIESMDNNSNYNLKDMLNNIFKIVLKECFYEIVTQTKHYMYIVIRYEPDSSININAIVDYFNNILIMVEEFMRINLRVGISGESASPDQYNRLREEADEALSRIISKDSELNVYIVNDKEENVDLINVDYYKSAICDLIFDENDTEPKQVLKEFGNTLQTEKICFDQCQIYSLVIYSAMIHKVVKYHLDIEQDFNQLERYIYKKNQSARTLYGLIEIGNELIDNLRSLCLGKKQVKNELVKRVDDCIKHNYKADLSLDFISNCLYLNGSYVSRAYKKFTGITVTEKINLFRLGKAKEMLKSTDKKIYEIADEVGFKDAAYFSNVFIKYCGMNPSEYRKNS